MEVITILAIVVGPVLALMVQRWLDATRTADARRLSVFRELMATRAARLSPRHVEALNLIELEFTGKKFAKVRAEWKEYLDSLSNTPTDEALQAVHYQSREEKFVTLVVQMGKSLGYSFDSVAIKRNAYSPIAHGELEKDQQLVRKGVVELLTGKRALSTLTWVMQPEPHKAQPPDAKQELQGDS